MADPLEKDILNLEARYTNLVKHNAGPKNRKIDHSLDRVDWVGGCLAAAARKDIHAPAASRGRGCRCGAKWLTSKAPRTEAVNTGYGVDHSEEDSAPPQVAAGAVAGGGGGGGQGSYYTCCSPHILQPVYQCSWLLVTTYDG
jgi:hypothetical protein